MNKQALLQYVDSKFKKNEVSNFEIGDTVRVHVKIIEGTSHRVQVFEGTVIAMKGHGGAKTFTVRKISFNIGVERIFPLTSPILEKVTVVRSGQVRRAKLYYLRDRLGRASRLEERESSNMAESKEAVKPVVAAVAPAAELVASKDK